MFGASILALGASLGLAGEARDDLVAMGRRIYREGRLASGEPVSATVQGDVPVLGTQFSCQSCHGRSGLGAGEGSVVVPPISGPLLFQAGAQLQRPAYDEAALARALRQGIDSAGRPLGALMPRYRLSDRESASLAAYLRSLSAVISPGVSESEIRFATVITSDVPAAAREAMLDVLRTYFDEKGRETRLESRRLGHDPPTVGGRRPSSYRRWALDVWDLAGPSSSWDEQLEALYRARPVFALVGGVSGLSWAMVHEFCERHELPCLLPSTDLPGGRRGGDFYSLYFSKGLFLEADLIAEHLGVPRPGNVVQVFRGEAKGALAAAALAARLSDGGSRVEDWPLAAREELPVARLAARLRGLPGSIAVLWLGRDELSGIGGLDAAGAGRIFLSSTFLDRRLDDLPSLSRMSAFVAHPYALPGRADAALTRFRSWLRSRGIPAREERIQVQAYFACLAVTEGTKHMERHVYRDYFMDVLDHAQGLGAYLPLYANPSLGPGQRFLAKGGYVLPLPAAPREGAAPPLIIP